MPCPVSGSKKWSRSVSTASSIFAPSCARVCRSSRATNRPPLAFACSCVAWIASSPTAAATSSPRTGRPPEPKWTKTSEPMSSRMSTTAEIRRPSAGSPDRAASSKSSGRMPRISGLSSKPFSARRLADEVLSRRPALKGFEDRPLLLGIRPEDLEDAALSGEPADGRRISAVVDIREDMGSEVFVHFGSGGRPVRGEDVAAAVGEEAIQATQEQAKAKGGLFVARLERHTRAQEGAKIELAVDTDRLHFFDPETGQGIYDERVAESD